MKYAKEVSRKQILKNNIYFKEGWMELIYSKHAIERLNERLRGSIQVYPKQVNISKLNINRGYTYDGKKLHKVIIRLEFKRDEWIFLVIIPNKRLVKSLWFSFKKYDRKTNRIRETVGIFPNTMEGNAQQVVPELSAKGVGTE